MAVKESIVASIQFEKRLKLDGVETMSHVISKDEIEISWENLGHIFKLLRESLKKALNDRFSFLER